MAEFYRINGVEYAFEQCFTCKTTHAFERSIYDAARQRAEKMSIYCPHGHNWHYVSGESEATKLRRERDRLKQEQARLQDRIREECEARQATERRLSAAKGQVTKIKNRAGRGVCPCCNRSFENLRRHMESKHPEFSSSEEEAA